MLKLPKLGSSDIQGQVCVCTCMCACAQEHVCMCLCVCVCVCVCVAMHVFVGGDAHVFQIHQTWSGCYNSECCAWIVYKTNAHTHILIILFFIFTQNKRLKAEFSELQAKSGTAKSDLQNVTVSFACLKQSKPLHICNSAAVSGKNCIRGGNCSLIKLPDQGNTCYIKNCSEIKTLYKCD